MRRGVALYLVGSAVLLALAGCGRGWLSFEERDPWRREAELACLNSGAVKPGPGITPVKPIEGPGICGADYPLKVAVLGESAILGYVSDLRPPASIPQALRDLPPALRPPAPVAHPASGAQAAPNPGSASPAGWGDAPLSLHPPGLEPDEDEEPETADVDPYAVPGAKPLVRPPQRGERRSDGYPAPRAPGRQDSPLPRLGPRREPDVSLSGTAVSVVPAATLACPMVSALDRWVAEAVQPAAQRWFNQPVVEIRQISAYSCRGMNGQRGAPISEHAFGNALDIAAFTLADGRRITVQDGWRGEPEEQGFLRDVQSAACDQFSTVLAPGSNIFHYDHIHVDLARRHSGRTICKPAAMPGDLIARRAYERRLTGRPAGRLSFAPEEDAARALEAKLPRAIPGAD
ncbi:MAG: extensin family protein [Variibacter sp.]|nr:extensin family protein [Variibacter sp.]